MDRDTKHIITLRSNTSQNIDQKYTHSSMLVSTHSSRDERDFIRRKKSISENIESQKKKIRRRKWNNHPNITPPFKLSTLEDLLHIAWNYHGDEFDWFTLWNMIPSLTELSGLVGMDKLKQGVIDLVIYHLQDLHRHRRKSQYTDESEGDMFHTVLYGSPGCGKTLTAHILAKIYCKMGFLPTENVVVAKRSDLIGKWIGHSESKTTEILNSALGGVLFIDEAYSMGHSERPDSFSKAAVDLINQFLSEHKGEMICIIAGYKKELNECFFSINRGLERRFPESFRFTIDSYSPEELAEIFRRKVRKEGWKLDQNTDLPALDPDFFRINKDFFPFLGGDIDNFFTVCKTIHARRIFGVKGVDKKLLTRSDIEKSLELFISNRKKKLEVSESVRNMFI